MTDFNIELLQVKNYNVFLIEKENLAVFTYVVELYYNNDYIGFASRAHETTDLKLNALGTTLEAQMWEWKGELYTSEITNLNGVKVEGMGFTHTDYEDIYLWLDGQVAKWIRDQLT